MFEKKLVHGYDAHEVLYLYCVSGAWVRASGFRTGPKGSHSENVLKFLTFLSLKGQNGSLNITLSLLPVYSLCALFSSSAQNHRTEASAFTDAPCDQGTGEW